MRYIEIDNETWEKLQRIQNITGMNSRDALRETVANELRAWEKMVEVALEQTGDPDASYC